MEELDNLTYEAFTRYFSVLEKTGYIKDSEVNKLLLLSFIQKFLKEYQYYITEEDYNIISRVISCLSGSSCLIPFKQYKQLSIPIDEVISTSINVRLSTEEDVRNIQEGNGVRLVNQ